MYRALAADVEPPGARIHTASDVAKKQEATEESMPLKDVRMFPDL